MPRAWALALSLGAALAVAPAALSAQTPATETLDRIAAVVGDRIILLSEVDEEINQRRAGGLRVPEDPAGLDALRRQVLEDLIDDEVVYQRARQDTAITVTDVEVQTGVDENYRRVRAQFRSDAEFRAALAANGWATVEEYRRWFAESQRRHLYRQRYVSKLRQDGQLRPLPVPEAELRRAYAEAMQNPEVQRRPPTISFRQVVIAPQPTPAARAAALARAESARVEIERGADFAAVARRLSDDISTRELGGDLGWFRRETMVREFSDIAFRMRPGVVSPPIRTPYGYHLILVDRVQPAEVKARHILFAPGIGPAELIAARAMADSMAALIRSGASADSLARLHGDSIEPRMVGPQDRTQMDSTYALALEGASAGAVVGPFATSPDGSARRTKLVVAQVTDVQPEREFSFDEVRQQLRQQLGEGRAIRQMLDQLRRQTYVDVRR